jgi:hypothetical protein
MRILVLVPYTSAHPYERAMRASLEAYMATRHELLPYFIQLRDQVEPIVINGSDMWLRGEETIAPGVLIKTICALEYCFESGVEFDWVVRANISTAINFARFPYGELAAVGCEYAGSRIGFVNDIPFVSGTDITLSRRCAQLLLQNRHALDYSLIDDVAIAQLFNRLGVRPYLIKNSRREMHGAPYGEYRNEDVSYAEVTPGMVAGGYTYRHRTDDRDADARQLATVISTFEQ